jgi:hypothetical protein
MTGPMPADPEPLPQTAERGLIEQCGALWHEAPRWRNLALAALGLTAGAVAIALFEPTREAIPTVPQPATEAQTSTSDFANTSCGMKPGTHSPGGTGQVVGFLTPAEALNAIQRTETRAQANISPEYLTNLRTVIERDGPSGKVHDIIALVPASMTVKLGDQVAYDGLHSDPKLPCHYVPNLISRVLVPNMGQAPDTAGSP